MTKTIENKNQLRREIIRLQSEVSINETQFKERIKEMREELRPQTLIINALTDITGFDFGKGDFFKSGLLATISIVLHRFIHKQESALEKKIVAWAKSILDKLRDFNNNEK